MLRVTVGETGRKKCFLLGRPDMIYRYLINDAFTVCYQVCLYTEYFFLFTCICRGGFRNKRVGRDLVLIL